MTTESSRAEQLTKDKFKPNNLFNPIYKRRQATFPEITLYLTYTEQLLDIESVNKRVKRAVHTGGRVSLVSQ